jgi:hypothetical protein
VARAVRTAQTQDNNERCRAADFDVPASAADMQAWGGRVSMSAFRRDAATLFNVRVEEAFDKGSRGLHMGVARPLPADFVDRFERLYGVDLREKLFLTKGSGLSTTCCCFPKCPFYLRHIGDPTPNMMEGGEKYVMSAGLQRHIKHFGDAVPGMHKAIRALDAEVPAAVVEGAVLNKSPLPKYSGKDYAGRLKARVDTAVGVGGRGDSSWVARSVASVIEETDAWTWDDFVIAMLQTYNHHKAAEAPGSPSKLGRTLSGSEPVALGRTGSGSVESPVALGRTGSDSDSTPDMDQLILERRDASDTTPLVHMTGPGFARIRKLDGFRLE